MPRTPVIPSPSANRKRLPVLAIALASPFLLQVPVAAADCDAVMGTWVPSRYYQQGSIVEFDGSWYQALDRHSGRQPDSGAFAWKAIDAPECAAEASPTSPEIASSARGEKAEDQPAGGDTRPGPAQVLSSSPAPAGMPCTPFSFGQSYLVGQRVEHEGQTYRAIRPTTGTLPGQGMPHHWELVEEACGD